MAYVRYGEKGQRPPGEWVQATLSETVVGNRYRESNVDAFCAAVAAADLRNLAYGVALTPQPGNPEDPYALAVFGQCEVKPWFRSIRLKEWHIGYVRRDLAREMHDEFLSQGIPIASHLRNIYRSGKYIEINFFILAPKGHSHSARMKRARS